MTTNFKNYRNYEKDKIEEMNNLEKEYNTKYNRVDTLHTKADEIIIRLQRVKTVYPNEIATLKLVKTMIDKYLAFAKENNQIK